MRKALKILRKIFFWIFFVVLFLVTTLTVILHVYEDDIKQYAIDELNEHLNAQVNVEDIELSVFHDFPYASIKFEKVFIADTYPEIVSNDTLFYANNVFFNFNIWDIYSGDYKVKRISVHDGSLQMKTAKDGQANFKIIKDTPDSLKKQDNFKFVLELLSLENMDYSYTNLATGQFYDFNVHNGLLKGDFTAENYDLEAVADLKIKRLKSNSFSLVKNKEAKLDLMMSIESTAKSYVFKKGDLTIEKMPFEITGLIDSSSIDLKFKGDNIQIHDVVNSLVDESLEDVKIYQGEGVVDFEAKIFGDKSAKSLPSVTADFSVSNGSIVEPDKNLQIHDINFVGHYQNEQEGRKEKLSFSDFNLKMLQSYFQGRAEVTDFKQPLLTTKMEGDLNLSRFHQFFAFNKIEKIGGSIVFNLDAVIQFFDPQYRKEKFKVTKSNGTFNLKNIAYKAVNDDIYYKDISGEIIVKNKDAAAQNLSVKTEKSDVLLNGAMINFIPFIEGTGNLGLIASVESNRIVLDEFLGEPNKSKSGPLKMFVMPDNLNLNVDMSVGELKWENHTFTNISSKVLMSSRKINLKRLNFDMLGGKVNGNLALNNLLQEGNLIEGKLNFENVDVKKLFTEWDNFDQKSITSNHISGLSTGNIDFLLSFNPYFSLIEDKLFADCDLTIRDGELNDLETMKAITAYMRSNKALKLTLNKHINKFEEKLLHLNFSDIQNKITIKDRRITIPKMIIRTNAVDVELFGWHDFDNQIEYHFSFRFRELKTKVEETEFGIIEDDGLGMVIYLTMFGDLDKPEYALDGDERRAHFKENLATEKKDIKSMLKSEFGLFKKDTTVQKIKKENQKEVQFIFYNEDEQEVQDSIINNEKNKKRSFKLFDKWKEEADKNKDKIEYEAEK